MDPILVFLVILIALVAVGFFFLFQKITNLTTAIRGEEILQRLELHKGELGGNLKLMEERLHAITTEIGGMKEVTNQLQEFQSSLKSQKLRGNVGEMVLEDLLHQVLPQSAYQTQFTFANGKRVDAVVKTRQGTIPIDSKFPVEKFQAFVAAKNEEEKASVWRAFVRDVKLRMDETAGYIRPEEGTVPFALMYIPYEPIFQEVVSDEELLRYTLEKRVFFTSPQTFLVTIQSILLGLQRERFAEQAEDILRTLHAVAKDASDFDGLLRRAATQMSDAKNNMDRLVAGFSTLLGKLEQLRDLEAKPKERQTSEHG